jgi:hypothetical protein
MAEFEQLEHKTYPYKTVAKRGFYSKTRTTSFEDILGFLILNNIDYLTPMPRKDEYRPARKIYFCTLNERNLFLLAYSEYFEVE